MKVLGRNFGNGFPRPHNGERMSASASKEDGEEKGGRKNGRHRVMRIDVGFESQGNAETMSEMREE
jgi:hypothetical protein